MDVPDGPLELLNEVYLSAGVDDVDGDGDDGDAI